MVAIKWKSKKCKSKSNIKKLIKIEIIIFLLDLFVPDCIARSLNSKYIRFLGEPPPPKKNNKKQKTKTTSRFQTLWLLFKIP